jgi:hypothetical protein
MSISPNGSDPERGRRHRAARVVAQYARDAEDLGELLSMLGLSAGEAMFRPCPAKDAGRIPEPRPASQTERSLATTLLAAVTEDLK